MHNIVFLLEAVEVTNGYSLSHTYDILRYQDERYLKSSLKKAE